MYQQYLDIPKGTLFRHPCKSAPDGTHHTYLRINLLGSVDLNDNQVRYFQSTDQVYVIGRLTDYINQVLSAACSF